jgi:uncharacterized metal-binding protein
MGKVAADHRLNKMEHGCLCVLTGAGGGLDMLVDRATRSRS